MAPNTRSARRTSAKKCRNSKKQPPTPASCPPQQKPACPLGVSHSIPNPIPDRYPCSTCGKCFINPKARAGHQNGHRNDSRAPIPESNGAVASQPPIRIRERQTYENTSNHLVNPIPAGNVNVSPELPTEQDKCSLWQHKAPCCQYHCDYEIDYNTGRYFKNSYLRKHGIGPSGSSITVGSKPIVMIDLTRLHDGRYC